MKIALLGYGKMGKVIEKIAVSRGHEIVVTIDNNKEWKERIPLVVGTTGWYNKMDVLKEKCATLNSSLLWASNFSIGVNIFFKINQELAKLMNKYENYDVSIEEIHHTAKLDAPSGTAISLANDIIGNIKRKNKWVLGESDNKSNLSINSKRVDPIPGTHSIKYESEIDDIEIIHTAKSREGFAMGSVIAAEWLVDKKGWYEFKEVFF